MILIMMSPHLTVLSAKQGKELLGLYYCAYTINSTILIVKNRYRYIILPLQTPRIDCHTLNIVIESMTNR